MMAHVARKGGRWYIVLEERDESGRRRQRWVSGFRSEEEARAALPAYARAEGETREVATVGGYLRRWHELRRKALRPTTWEQYRWVMERYIVPRIGRYPLSGLRGTDLDDLYDALLAEGLAPATVRQVHAILRKAYADAVRRGLVTTNPVLAATPPKVEEPELEVWTPQQLQRFLEAAREDEWWPLWRLAVVTGMRRGELLGLQRADIDFQAGVLFVRRSVAWTGSGVVVTRPKTKKGVRGLLLDPLTLDELRAYLDRHPACSSWLWSCGEEPPSPNTLTKRFARIVERARLPHIRFHDLRHSNATLALLAGVDPKVLQTRLGHHSAAFTMDRYQHALLGAQLAATEAMSRVLDSAAALPSIPAE